MENRDQADIARLSLELERLAGELGRLGGVAEEKPKKARGRSRERPADRLRRRLHEARRARGLRQSDLADRLGRPQSFVSNFERGVRRLEVSEFIEIAHLLGVDPAALVGELARDS
ncbi:MAG: helix-turn-helix domain-containing protein [Allosphingosinicella sp.]